jgi:hypothetical protein
MTLIGLAHQVTNLLGDVIAFGNFAQLVYLVRPL